MDDLFHTDRLTNLAAAQPLAARMRPSSFDEVVGHAHLLGPTAAFRAAVERGRPLSVLLWGPPGSGKTTLARLIAEHAKAEFVQLSAVTAGVKDVRETIASARTRIEEGRGGTVLFLDEIHRFNKAQQDALLPAVEDGIVTLVGATTENPYFEVNAPLLSRMNLFRLDQLTPDEVQLILAEALANPDRGLGSEGLEFAEDAAAILADRAGGDARLALNTLELAARIAQSAGRESIVPADVEEALQRRIIRYDKAGDRHYDVISAFIKSVRGSDVDAAVYWLHVMLEAGEDPEFIARRLLILASEDVGLARSSGLTVAMAAADALAYVGLPEAAYHLTHATIYLAVSPKSNSVGTAMAKARQAIADHPHQSVPQHLRSAAYPGAGRLGHGEGYVYPHDHPARVVYQQYLPDGLTGEVLYRPGSQGYEAELASDLEAIDMALRKTRHRGSGPES